MDDVWTPEFVGETPDETDHPCIYCKRSKLRLVYEDEEYCIDVDKHKKEYSVEISGVVYSGASLRKLMDEIYKVRIACIVTSIYPHRNYHVPAKA